MGGYCILDLKYQRPLRGRCVMATCRITPRTPDGNCIVSGNAMPDLTMSALVGNGVPEFLDVILLGNRRSVWSRLDTSILTKYNLFILTTCADDVRLDGIVL